MIGGGQRTQATLLVCNPRHTKHKKHSRILRWNARCARASDGDAGNRLDFYSSVGQRDIPLITLAPALYCEPGFSLQSETHKTQHCISY